MEEVIHVRHDKTLFVGCFIALITTSYAFISRMVLCGSAEFMREFGLDKVDVGELQGAGVWPFGVSIIVFSLFIDRIGYKTAMLYSFASYVAYAALAFAAYSAVHVPGLSGAALAAAQKHGHKLLYWGSIILGLGNGSVETYVNPIVATMFRDEKTKWLNYLHAGWPGGLVLGGFCTVALAANPDWRVTLGLVLIPACAFLLILLGRRFPKSEREQAGVSYLQMLKELGAFGALVGFGLVFAQLGQPDVFGWGNAVSTVLTGLAVLAFAVLTRSFGRPLLAFLIVLMMPQAITELGTDGWITSLMQVPMQAAGFNPAWVLIYTSGIMVVFRFLAGAPVKKLSPLGLLAVSTAVAAIGLVALSETAKASLLVIFGAATIYAIGKTFLWPTMLGLTSEQCPKGGTLTLNAMGGIGMLAVGIIGLPFMGYLQESTTTKQLANIAPAVYQKVAVQKRYLLGEYQAIDPVKAAALTDEPAKSAIQTAIVAGQFGALGKMALVPALLLVCYLVLIWYFHYKGGYVPVRLVTPSPAGKGEA